MRWILAAVMFAFCALLVTVWVVSKRADPKMIRVDPVAVDHLRWQTLEQGKWQAHPDGLATIH